jgi:hypothetical protein
LKSFNADPVLFALVHVAAEGATRAVLRCQPYRLPLSKYEAWRDK